MEGGGRSVVLAGIKHCGKTTLGQQLAARWGLPFADTDAELEKVFAARTGRKLATRPIYIELGPEKFRQLEAEVIADLAAAPGRRVIALGGGVPANPFVKPEALRALGLFVYLEIRPEIAFDRVLRRGLPPFLEGKDDPFAEFCRINAERERHYLAFAELRYPIVSEVAPALAAAALADAIDVYLK